MPRFSDFASSVQTETAFDVLATAKKLKADGKDVIELEIGDSPFPTATNAAAAGIKAIEDDLCHYGPSIGLPEFRTGASEYVNREYGLQTSAENIVVGPGAKTFEEMNWFDKGPIQVWGSSFGITGNDVEAPQSPPYWRWS